MARPLKRKRLEPTVTKSSVPPRSTTTTTKNTKVPARDEAVRVLKCALDRLSIGALVDGDVLGREDHIRHIQQFITGDTHCSLMLFGMPGTGKTCAVKQALARIGDSAITAIMLNGYIVQRPTDVYRTLCQHLSRHRLGLEETLPPEQAANFLEKRFRSLGWGKSQHANRTCVIVMDEMDKCIEKNPKVLYRIVEWLALPHAHCRLIGIANSMEFPLDQKTKSRLDSTNQIVFQPYTEAELQAILRQRLSAIVSRFTVMSDRAVEYMCRQTASQYGDVRRLLQASASSAHGLLCSIEEGEVTINEADLKEKGIIDFRHVHAVVSRVFQERFRDFVFSVKSPLLFLVIAVITVETRRLEAARGGSVAPSVGLHVLYARCLEVLDAYHARLDIMDPKLLSMTLFLKCLSTLRDIGFVEVAIQAPGTQRDGGHHLTPLHNVRDVLSINEETVVTMTQLPEIVQTMCEVHDMFGAIMKPFLATAPSTL